MLVLCLQMARRSETKTAVARKLFQQRGGVLRMAEVLRHGIPRATLYGMRDHGIVEQLSRGVYRLKSSPMLGHPDLVTVATRVPRGVICLISALAYHRLTAQIPHELYLAIE